MHSIGLFQLKGNKGSRFWHPVQTALYTVDLLRGFERGQQDPSFLISSFHETCACWLPGLWINFYSADITKISKPSGGCRVIKRTISTTSSSNSDRIVGLIDHRTSGLWLCNPSIKLLIYIARETVCLAVYNKVCRVRGTFVYIFFCLQHFPLLILAIIVRYWRWDTQYLYMRRRKYMGRSTWKRGEKSSSG